MGICMTGEKEPQAPKKNKTDMKSKIENVDVVKIKLKQARDSINNFVKRKEKDLAQINAKIKQQLPEYQETGNKKKIVPLLKAKKDVENMIDTADTRLKLVNEKLTEVELQQMDVETINVLDDSNQFIKGVQAEMQKKDWRNVIDEAKNKYELDWGEREDIEEDEEFQSMWKELGGDKIPAKKGVNVDVNVNTAKNTTQQKREMALA